MKTLRHADDEGIEFTKLGGTPAKYEDRKNKYYDTEYCETHEIYHVDKICPNCYKEYEGEEIDEPVYLNNEQRLYGLKSKEPIYSQANLNEEPVQPQTEGLIQSQPYLMNQENNKQNWKIEEKKLRHNNDWNKRKVN